MMDACRQEHFIPGLHKAPNSALVKRCRVKRTLHMVLTAGAAGADVAIAAADVALFTNDLRCLPHVVRLGRLVRTKVAQNVALAVLTKVRLKPKHRLFRVGMS